MDYPQTANLTAVFSLGWSSTRLALQEVDFESSKISLPHCDAVQVHRRPAVTKAWGGNSPKKPRLWKISGGKACLSYPNALYLKLDT